MAERAEDSPPSLRRLRTTEGRRRLGVYLALSLVPTLLVLAAYLWPPAPLRLTERSTVDARVSVRGKRSPPPDLVVVKIDDSTFQALQLRWPFPRSLHAKVIDRISADHPKAIAYDVDFAEPRNGDLALTSAIAKAKGRVVLATTEVDADGRPAIFGGGDILRQIGARAGDSSFAPGVIRSVPYGVDRLKSLAVQAAEVATGRRTSRDSFDGNKSWIDYYGPPDTIKSVPFSQVALGRTKLGSFRNKIVVVGATSPTLRDLHTIPITGELMSGPEIQANAIDTVRRGFPLKPSPHAVGVALILLLGIGVPLSVLWLSPLRALGLVAAAGAIFTVGAQAAFQGGIVLPFIYPLAALAGSSLLLISLAAHYSQVDFQRAQLRGMFARFLPEPVVDEVLAPGQDGLALEGRVLESSILFCDLRNFTGFAESLPPERVIAVLNRYLSEMSEAILDHRGTLVSYAGDGVMAVFGAPIEQADHADRALAAAREMLGERLPRFNRWLREEGLSETGFRMGIGLNSGPVMSGNVGSERRLEYTAIGDTTNTAARLEALTKETHHQSLVSESTRSRLSGDRSDLTYVGELPIRGRRQREKLWALPY